jgi:short-subunit dehydrogenase
VSDFWKDKTVMLTGASSGIGAALAVAIAKKGAAVGLLARREELLTKISNDCEKFGSKSRVFPCDVVDSKAVQDAAESLSREFGRIDILIANAGIGGNNKETRELNTEAVKKVIDINLLGTVNAVSAVLPKMLEQGSGQIVGISSLAGFRGLPKSAAYSASKAGMTAFLESVRLDVLHKGIDVTIIQPGFIETPLTSGRKKKLPFLMKLEDSIPYFLDAIERKKKFSAFPWQLATVVRIARFLPASIYDAIAGRASYRE